ncbi:MAG TPA: NAD(P)H-dependent glycerol-3-phosphate dehydrogenase [Candidatus Limnocylindria bacterium]|nr:NAD(P)H-dependent glycerol-3-phosphate dehydrogenase [Candidatus Limnocylindria bacterium]
MSAAGDVLGVVGAGAWGTTLAVRLAEAGHPVLLWAHTDAARRRLATDRENVRYLRGVGFPPSLAVAADDVDLQRVERLHLLAVPSAHLRSTLQRLAPGLGARVPLLSLVKGIEEGTHLRMSEVIGEELPGRPVAVLSGPNIAREIAAGKPAGSVVASPDASLANACAELLSSDRFRVYTNPDVVGVELAGALKNIVAIAAGMSDGLGFGDSAKAGIITRGLAEVTRLGVAAGAHPLTFAGLAGVGDLFATCISPLTRNRLAGELLARGEPWVAVEPQLPGVAEGVATLPGALALAAQYGVELPIAEQVNQVVHHGRSPLAAVAELMAREPKDELADVGV